MKLLKLLIILIGIFSISIYMRASYIEKEVHPSNETSIIMLTVLENWQSLGIANYHFAPVITWQNNSDKNMANYKRLEDKSGNNYYVSYPPMAFILPYFISSLFNITPNQIFLQIFNIILHFISALLIYLIICKYFNKNPKQLNGAALVGFISYTFMPVLLYVHTFDFFSEIMGQVFLIIGIYLFQFLSKENGTHNIKLLLLFGLNLFILIYTEWIGIFFSFSILLWLLLEFRKKIFLNNIFKTVIIASSLSILLLLIQYSGINGLSNLTKSLSLRFLERSGLFGEHYSDMGISYTNSYSYILLFQQIHQTLIGFGYIMIFLLIWWLIKCKYSFKRLFCSNKLVIPIVLPVILSFLFFFNATLIHYNWLAKFGMIISIGIGILTFKIANKYFNYKSQNIYKLIFLLIIMLTIAISFIEYKKHSLSLVSDSSKLKIIGNIINKNSNNDESIFINVSEDLLYYNTYLCYITKRNLVNVPDFEADNKILKEKKKTKGVFFTFEKQNIQFNVTHFK